VIVVVTVVCEAGVQMLMFRRMCPRPARRLGEGGLRSQNREGE